MNQIHRSCTGDKAGPSIDEEIAELLGGPPPETDAFRVDAVGIEAALAAQTAETAEPAAGDPLCAAINERHAVILNGGRVMIATWKRGGKIEFGPLQDLHNWYANRPFGDNGAPVSKWWMRHPERREYRGGVIFAPGGAPSDTLNLWTGFALKPRGEAEGCKHFLWHLQHVICAGNETHFGWIIRWMAHMVQRPEEKPGVALVLKGNRGAGKDAVGDYLAPIFGRHAFKLTTSHSLTGRFNRHLADVLFLHVEEGFWAGDKAAESTLKSLVTSRELTIEAKGIDAINMPSYLRLFITSNEDWVVPSGHDERRWAIFEVSDLRKQDHGYFEALFHERDNGGAAALLSVLQSIDLSGFDVRAVPLSSALIDQKLASLAGLEAWWCEIMVEGRLPSTFDQDGAEWERAVTLPRQVLRDAYDDWTKKNPKLARTVTANHFGRELRKLVGPGLRDSQLGRRWHYTLPPLAECRESFGARYGARYVSDQGEGA